MRTFTQVSKDWEKTFNERLPGGGPGGFGIREQVPLLEECLAEKSTKKYDDWRKKMLAFFKTDDVLT